MKHKSRFLLPILTLLTFGMVTGSVAVSDFVKNDKEALADTVARTVYLTKPDPCTNESEIKCVYNGQYNHVMEYAYTNSNSQNVYRYTIPAGVSTFRFQFYSNWNDRGWQENNADLTVPSNDTTGWYDSKNDWWSWPATQWDVAVKPFTINFYGNGATGGSMSSMLGYARGKMYLKSNSFAKLGYSFLGWATSPNGSVVYSDGGEVNRLTSDSQATLNLYAKWGTGTGCGFGGILVELNADHSDWKNFYIYNSDESKSSGWDNNVFGINLTSLGTYFWYIDIGNWDWVSEEPDGLILRTSDRAYKTGDITIPTGALECKKYFKLAASGSSGEITGEWKNVSFNITFDGNGSTGGSTSTIEAIYNTGYTLTNSFTKTGHSFTGWATSASGVVVYDNSHLTLSATDINDLFHSVGMGQDYDLFAKWTANNYTVTLDKQSGSGGDDSVSATFDSAMPSLAGKLPTRTGYDFDGYYGSTGGSGTQYYNADGSSASDWDVASNDTIYAKWNVKSFNITYGSNYGGFIDKVNTGYFGQAFYITTNTYLNPGYTWTNGTLYVYPGTDRSQAPLATYSITRATDQESFTMTGTYYENLYIYLEWTRTANQYTVTLDKGTGSGGPNTVTATYYEYLPKGIEFPTKPGCEFDGYWGNKEGTERQYYSEEGYQFAIWDTANDGTIYAKWYQFYDFNVAITDGLNLKGTLEQEYISSKGIKYVDVHYPNCDELNGAFLDKRYTISDSSVDFEDLCVPVNAAQLTDNITLTLRKTDESIVKTFDVTIAFVLNEKIIEGVEAGTEAGTKKANLCASIMLYGSCVQVVYNHNMGDLAHNRITDATTKAYVMSLFNSKTLVDDPEDSYNNNDGLFDMATVGSAAGLNTTINYRFYFQCSNEDLKNYEFSWNPDVGGKLSGVEWDGEVHTEVINKVTWRYYELTGFKPTDTHDMFTITITKGGKTFTADYSIYAYLYKVYNTSTYSNYVSIAKSLEVYHDTAVAYVG